MTYNDRPVTSYDQVSRLIRRVFTFLTWYVLAFVAFTLVVTWPMTSLLFSVGFVVVYEVTIGRSVRRSRAYAREQQEKRAAIWAERYAQQAREAEAWAQSNAEWEKQLGESR